MLVFFFCMISNRYKCDHSDMNPHHGVNPEKSPVQKASPENLRRATWMPHVSRHSGRLSWQPFCQWVGAEVFWSPGQLVCEKRQQVDKGKSAGAYRLNFWRLSLGSIDILFCHHSSMAIFDRMMRSIKLDILLDTSFSTICPSLCECWWSKPRFQCKVTWSGNTCSTPLIVEWVFHFSKFDIQICAQQSRSHCPSH